MQEMLRAVLGDVLIVTILLQIMVVAEWGRLQKQGDAPKKSFWWNVTILGVQLFWLVGIFVKSATPLPVSLIGLICLIYWIIRSLCLLCDTS